MIVRPARPDDLGAILGLARALALQENDTRAENILPTFKVYVAEDRQIVGFAAVDRHLSDAAVLVSLYVSGGWRRSGIGTGLVRAVMQDVGPGIELGVLVAPNNLPARAFSLNFQRVIRNGEYADHGEYWNLTLTTA